MDKEQEKQVMIHEYWIAFRRQYNKVKEPNKIKITNEEVEEYIKRREDDARRDLIKEVLGMAKNVPSWNLITWLKKKEKELKS